MASTSRLRQILESQQASHLNPGSVANIAGTEEQIKLLFLEVIGEADIVGPLHPQTSLYKQELHKLVEAL